MQLLFSNRSLFLACYPHCHPKKMRSRAVKSPQEKKVSRTSA